MYCGRELTKTIGKIDTGLVTFEKDYIEPTDHLMVLLNVLYMVDPHPILEQHSGL